MSAETYVYGASDDLIEIEGALREEFYSSGDEDEGDLLTFSTGVVLRVRYTDSGIWEIRPLAGGSRVTIEYAPSDDEDNYSDRVVLHDAPAWVVCGNKFATALR